MHGVDAAYVMGAGSPWIGAHSLKQFVMQLERLEFRRFFPLADYAWGRMYGL